LSKSFEDMLQREIIRLLLPARKPKPLWLIYGRREREKMLTKKVRITAFDAKGERGTVRELTAIAFNKDGSMAMLPSKAFKEVMDFLDVGGVIIIEKVWEL